MLMVATIIAVMVSLTRGDVAYAAVIVWAYIGIAVKHVGVPSVSVSAILLAIAAAGSLLVGVPNARPLRV